MIILETKDWPSPAVLVLLIAAMAVLEARGGWWLVAGVGVLGAWVLVAVVHQAFLAVHVRLSMLSEELEEILDDMELPDDDAPT